MARLMRVFAPGQIDKIAVRQLKALPVRGKAQFTANQPRQHGLQMTIAHAAHRMELTRIVFGGRHVCGDDFNHSTRTINKRDDDYTAQGMQGVSQYVVLRPVTPAYSKNKSLMSLMARP